jgi:ribonuclease P protein component
VKRRFRLTRSNDIKRVRRFGKSYAHPLVVLVVEKSSDSTQRIAVITGKSIGGAVTRNLVRRRLKAICDRLLPELVIDFQALLIGREPSQRASFEELESSTLQVFQRAGLIVRSHE